jgi:hypothetical protein
MLQVFVLMRQQEDADVKVIARDLVRLLLQDDERKAQVEAAVRDAAVREASSTQGQGPEQAA